MDKEQYVEIINSISIKFGLNKSDFVDIEIESLSEEYRNIIGFYSETLLDNAHHGILPSFIAITNHTSFNAKAIRKGDNSLVVFFKGLVLHLCNLYLYNDKLNNTEIRFLKIIRQFLDADVNKLMYQAATHFTFYHEMAHLIQFASSNEASLDEAPNFTEDYILEKHLLEIDADEFSSLCLSEHIIQYHNRLFRKGKSETYEGLLVLFLAPIVLYLLGFKENKRRLYFYEGSHPHPVIRLMLITLTITDYCRLSLSKHDKDIQINHLDVIENALALAQDIESRYLSTNDVADLILFIRANLEEIMNYVAVMKEAKDKRTDLAVDSWNNNV
jgi:hypothetical protein